VGEVPKNEEEQVTEVEEEMQVFTKVNGHGQLNMIQNTSENTDSKDHQRAFLDLIL